MRCYEVCWEVSYNTNRGSLQRLVVEAGSAEEAERKVEQIVQARHTSGQFWIHFNGVRVI